MEREDVDDGVEMMRNATSWPEDPSAGGNDVFDADKSAGKSSMEQISNRPSTLVICDGSAFHASPLLEETFEASATICCTTSGRSCREALRRTDWFFQKRSGVRSWYYHEMKVG